LGGVLYRRQLLPGEKRGLEIGKTKRGKGTKCMVVVDGKGVPLGVFLASASPAEVTLVHPTLATIAVPRNGPGRPRSKPDRLIADKAYDSEALRADLARRQIDLIAPHRRIRVRAARQDGHKLRRYKRRWIVERTFAWYGSFRRLVVRSERSPSLYLAFFHLASALIVMRRL
jgi:transposase